MKTQTLHIKGMLSNSCIVLVEMVLAELHIEVISLIIGQAKVKYNPHKISFDNINSALSKYNFKLVKTADELLIDRVKQAVIDMIYHMNNMNSIVQKSEYLVEMLKMSYDKISREFNKQSSTTLEKFIIKVKIERIKELLENGSYSLSEISFMMDYSSVQHLSTQFKKVTGLTVSEYKKCDKCHRIPLDEL